MNHRVVVVTSTLHMGVGVPDCSIEHNPRVLVPFRKEPVGTVTSNIRVSKDRKCPVSGKSAIIAENFITLRKFVVKYCNM
ncbi:hypothetical protein DPMN_103094 [Dreissena polymorpha]|uniref:Uncharacterized protein n=1 Tax=Dreissena polymorpha TaxID=45954 RepID=A0A9D4K0H0_DREPO|nr:hypothetical protein DPMN_103094 [Dreissena polymorpha]